MTTRIFLTYLISSILQHIEFILAYLYILETDKKTATRPMALLIYVLMWFPLFTIQLTNKSWVILSIIPFLLIYALALHFVTHRPLLSTIICSAFGYFVIVLTDQPGFIYYLLFIPSAAITEGWPSLVFAIPGAILLFFLLKYAPVRKIFRSLCKIPVSIAYFLLTVFAFVAIFCQFPENSISFVSASFFALLSIFLCTSAVFLMFQIFSNQKNQAALRYYRQYLPILDNLIQKVRDTQHSHNNMVQSLVHLSELDMDSEQLRSHLAAYTEDMQQAILPSSFLTLENKLLAALFYYKYCQAESAGIHMDFAIENPLCPSRAGEFELVDAVGVLLDNALENSRPGETVYVRIGVQEKEGSPRTHLTVENPGPTADDSFLHRIFSKGYTTKKTDEDSHGIGLHSLQSLTRKHHGLIIVSNTQRQDSQYICFELLL